MAPNRIVLCADDYGLSPGVSRGIRELLDAGRLSATSCMTVYPEFEIDGPLLRPWFDKADIGLHFTLTAKRPVGEVMRQAYFGGLDRPAVAAELHQQLEQFERVMGRAPDYIDGHQHVHLYPGVRELVAQAAEMLGIYVRSTFDPVNIGMWARPSPVEATFLSLTAHPLMQLLAKATVPTNQGFRGVRNFRERVPYRELFRKMIGEVKDRTIVMCHPGHTDDVLAARDGVIAAREGEYAYFVSNAFADDLATAGAALSRLPDTEI